MKELRLSILPGLLICGFLGIIAYFLGKSYPLVGGPVFGIFFGLIFSNILKDKESLKDGIYFSSKQVLRSSVIFLGFGLNLGVIAQTGLKALPVIIAVIFTSIFMAKLLSKVFNISDEIGTLIGVGTAICGVSAIVATDPVISAKEEDVSQGISVIFIFNITCMLAYPLFLHRLGVSDEFFAVFAGTTIHNTSSVAATAAAWDTLRGSNTLPLATIVKLTRTLGILPITLIFAMLKTRREREIRKFDLINNLPMFILLFLLSSLITTVSTAFFNIPSEVFTPFNRLSKLLIPIAMVAIGINTDLEKLTKSGFKLVGLGFICWSSVCIVSYLVQKVLFF